MDGGPAYHIDKRSHEKQMPVLSFPGISGRFFFLYFPSTVQGSLSVEDGHLHRGSLLI